MITSTHSAFISLLIILSVIQVGAQSASEAIRLNQIGFYPNAPKIAVLVGEVTGPFEVTTSDLKTVVFKGILGPARKNFISGKTTHLADFSAFTSIGTFVVNIPGVGYSYPFAIKPMVYHAAAIASLKGFYYQRASTDLPATYAGQWHRAAGHPDAQVLIHPSAASANRLAGTTISSPRGWYDAGDYNKYIVNSGITMGTLLSLYEDFPAYCQTVKSNIPESNNSLPDLLDEVLWNLRWMLTMQDKADGGVYHKLTNAGFDGMVMPAQAGMSDRAKERYVVQKSITAALDFTAVMAQAARVLKPFNRELPGLSDSCLTASLNAWQWAKKNPDLYYRQNEMNQRFDPDVTTGSYEDKDASDEWIWAATELYVTTKDEAYIKAVTLFPDDKTPLPSWPQVRTLGYYTLTRFIKDKSLHNQKALTQAKNHIVDLANTLIDGADQQVFGTVMGKSAKDFIWGSSSEAANQGIALIQAYRLTGDKKYLTYALTNLDYLFGRNAVGYSFLTGFGHKSTMNPHHRPSVADGIEAPVPGLLSGGTNANAARQDKCPGYTTTIADEVYLDQSCSYASNEIAINWNAPMVYLANAIEALQREADYSKGQRK